MAKLSQIWRMAKFTGNLQPYRFFAEPLEKWTKDYSRQLSSDFKGNGPPLEASKIEGEVIFGENRHFFSICQRLQGAQTMTILHLDEVKDNCSLLYMVITRF